MKKDIKSTLFKLYGIWLLADFIVFGASSIIVWATGSLVDLIASLLVSAALGAIPFPFNILVVWSIDPISVVAQTAIFGIIVFFWFYTSRD